jgi:uncharacterized protein with PQ loop repeat
MTASYECVADVPSGGHLVNAIVMGLLALGTVVSFIPQWVSIIVARSSAGVSPTTIALMNLANASNTVGVLVANWGAVSCCLATSFWPCNIGLLPVWLVGSNIVGSLPVFFLVVLFFVADASELDSSSSDDVSITVKVPREEARDDSLVTIAHSMETSTVISSASGDSSLSGEDEDDPLLIEEITISAEALERATRAGRRRSAVYFAIFLIIMLAFGITAWQLLEHLGFEATPTQSFAKGVDIFR